MSARSKESRVVGWENGNFLYALPGGRLADALGIIIDTSTVKADTSTDKNQVEPNDNDSRN